MKIAKIERNSIANGPGIRLVVWCQGCSIHCPGCHNQETWDPNGGEYLTEDKVNYILKELEKPWVRGVTFSGGHPLEDYNVKGVIELATSIKEKFPEKDIWLYTGKELTMNDFIKIDDMGICLRLCDVVVDGPFMLAQRDIRLPYRGSRNQRIILVKDTLKQNKIVIQKE